MSADLRSLYHGSAIYNLSLMGRAPRELALKLEPWPGDPARGEALLRGEFRFDGETISAPAPPWQTGPSDEWRAQLHSFCWLGDLAALGNEAAWQAAREWTADWLRHFHVYDRIAWRADAMGERLFAWLEYFDRLALDASLREAMLKSVARQSRHLARVAHREDPGLKRLAALRGLIAALAAQVLDRALDRAVKHFVREIEQQILPDGGHLSRNPEAQLKALRYLVDTRGALTASHNEVDPAIQQAIDRTAPILRFFRHGDGRFGLFNGASEGDAAVIDRVLMRADAKGRAPASAPHCGYERLRAGHSLVLFDCGKPPPPGFDTEAHAGPLAFEMSYGRERLIVNCGAYHGPSAEWSEALKATAAHSTLTVADTSALDLRPDGSVAAGPSEVSTTRAEEGGAQWVAASHDGYKPGLGLVHARQLFLAADGEDLRGEDRLTGRAGQGFAVRFHLHPNVQASLAQDGTAAVLRLPSGIGWRLRMQGAVLSIAESIYIGSGVPKKTRQIVLDGHVGTTGAVVKWALRREARRPQEPGEPELSDDF